MNLYCLARRNSQARGEQLPLIDYLWWHLQVDQKLLLPDPLPPANAPEVRFEEALGRTNGSVGQVLNAVWG